MSSMRKFAERSKQPFGTYDELLTLVKKRKLRWFGHVSRSSGLAKTILQDTVQGKRRKRRQRKRREDASSARVAEDRTGWKGIVAKSYMVPHKVVEQTRLAYTN